MKKVREALVVMLLVAIGLRVAAAVVTPAIPLIVVLVTLVYILWLVIGRPGRL
jgi:hypothetical protein